MRAAVSVGFRKFRLTGGEPTLRADLLEIVERLAAVPGLGDLALTTNALLLPKLAMPLRAAGLKRINVHLDSLNPLTVERQMRWGSFAHVWEGIMAAEAAGLVPIKLNAVVAAGYNEEDVVDLAALTIARDWHVRFIELMPLGGGECATLSIKRYVSNIETRRRIEVALGPLMEFESSNPSDEARNYTLAGRERRGRLHQPGERALLRDLQPDAAYGRRQVPSLPAERRRDGRAQGAFARAAGWKRWRASWCARSSSSRPAITCSRAARRATARCTRSAVEAYFEIAALGLTDDPGVGCSLSPAAVDDPHRHVPRVSDPDEQQQDQR